ncbi:hypothetical protein [Dyella jiangningensis]|uniref:Uncharacterized protein n=1 Tax=Dyella jiangningensis TaxID=1379159 RepID=A0A328P903_9GAMM|nr:hypothetical protein [Dyella jiangningensis]RAO76764.1 hypothetical protein CA260_02250 [Dyella jiangningensis]
MQQFIPFEDDWDALENLRPDMLVPYHVGVPCRHDLAAANHCDAPAATMASASPTATTLFATAPAVSSHT